MLVEKIDLIWLIVCSLFSFFIPIGFLLLEAGISGRKNDIHIGLKYIIAFFSSVFFLWIGFFHFGFIGSFNFQDGILGILKGMPFIFINGSIVENAFFLFQISNVAIITSIISLVVSEKVRIKGYILVIAPLIIILYFFIARFLWSDKLIIDRLSWLTKMGFYDFSGANAIHTLIGFYSLALLMHLKPTSNYKLSHDYLGNSRHITIGLIGLFIVLIGWLSYTGTHFVFSNDNHKMIIALINVSLSCSAAIITAVLIEYFINKRNYTVFFLFRNMFGGLIIVSGCANLMSTNTAVFLGVFSAFIIAVGEHLLMKLIATKKNMNFLKYDRYHIILSFLVCGILGTLFVSFFPSSSNSKFSQFFVQLISLIFPFVFGFIIPYILFRFININKVFGLTIEDSSKGLNLVEFGISNELLDINENFLKIGNKLKDKLDNEEIEEIVFNDLVIESEFKEFDSLTKTYNQVIHCHNNIIKKVMEERDANKMALKLSDYEIENNEKKISDLSQMVEMITKYAPVSTILINHNLIIDKVISNSYSVSDLNNINLQEKSFIAFLHSFAIGTEKIKQFRKYFNLLFNMNYQLKESVVFMNPFRELDVFINNQKKTLTFRFNPLLKKDKKVNKVMVSIIDISDIANRKKALLAERQIYYEETNWLKNIIYSNPTTVIDFMKQLSKFRTKVENSIKKLNTDRDKAFVIINDIKKNVNLIKQDIENMNIAKLQEVFYDFENRLGLMIIKDSNALEERTIKERDFVSLVAVFEKFNSICNLLSDILDRIKNYSKNLHST